MLKNKSKIRKFSHIDADGLPTMVDVSSKPRTFRTARAQAVIDIGAAISEKIYENELHTSKGPVFQTAVIAGTMGAKRTADLIPMCHPLGLEDYQVRITHKRNKIIIGTLAKLEGKTGVEMEALTGAAIAALTVYDMCKSISHDIKIEEIALIEKTGGKKDLKRK